MNREPPLPSKYIGVLVGRDPDSYPAIYHLWQHGQTYVPLNSKYPVERLQSILQQVPLDVILVTQKQLENLSTEVLNVLKCHAPLQLSSIPFSPTYEEKLDLKKINAETIAYILFTSGSTGAPKGVPITYGNLAHFVEVMQRRYQLTDQDRIAQFTNLSFDMSMFDLALAWSTGACLYPVPEAELLAPADFIRRSEISVWYSVPSVITTLIKLNLLKANSFPSLRLSLFAGEALSKRAAEAWQLAAPHSRVENLFGPTEATVSCLVYTCASKNVTPEKFCSVQLPWDMVPIGKPLPGNFAAIIDEKLTFLSAQQSGELLLAGKQLSPGYWQQPLLAQQKFIELDHPLYGLQRWYRTGDLALQDEQGEFHYLGRIDNQVKISGYRIELEEIERHLKTLLQQDDVAVTVYIGEAGVLSLAAVYPPQAMAISKIKNRLKQLLPYYMIPTYWLCAATLPYNQNGKLDRKQLQLWVQKNLFTTATIA